MNVLIVVPRWVSRPYDYYAFPLGLAYIAASIKKAGHTLSVLNLNHEWGDICQLIHQKIATDTIDIACTGGLSVHYKLIKTIIDSCKDSPVKVATILGGGLLSSDPDLIYSTLLPDFGVIGEGEITIQELLAAIAGKREPHDVMGVIYTSATGEKVTTPARPAIEDLDTLPWLEYEAFGVEAHLDAQLNLDENYLHMHDKPRMLTMISSRSCPYRCTFCFHPLGNKYRERSLDDFFNELDFLVKKYRLNSIMILDELFAANKDRVDECCRRIKPYGITWVVQLRVDLVTEELLLKMKDSGCVFISYGIESVSDTVLKSMQKKIKRTQIEKALDLTYKAGIGIQGNLIFGDSAETVETFEESIQWWSEHRYVQIAMSGVYAYPGTQLYQDARKKGAIPDPIAFIEQGCQYVNATNLSNKVLFDLIRDAEILHELPYAKALSAVRNVALMPERSPLRGDLLITFKTTCPSCSSELTYKNVPLGNNPMGRSSLRMACKVCNHRFDMPFTLRVSKQDPELDVLVNKAEGLLNNGQFPAAYNILSGVLEKEWLNEKALFLGGLILLKLEKNQDALEMLSLASRVSPLSIEIRSAMAVALTRVGRHFTAMMHLKQAWEMQKIAEEPQGAEKLTLLKLSLY